MIYESERAWPLKFYSLLRKKIHRRYNQPFQPYYIADAILSCSSSSGWLMATGYTMKNKPSDLLSHDSTVRREAFTVVTLFHPPLSTVELPARNIGAISAFALSMATQEEKEEEEYYVVVAVGRDGLCRRWYLAFWEWTNMMESSGIRDMTCHGGRFYSLEHRGRGVMALNIDRKAENSVAAVKVVSVLENIPPLLPVFPAWHEEEGCTWRPVRKDGDIFWLFNPRGEI
jgi:hypothetical protein